MKKQKVTIKQQAPVEGMVDGMARVVIQGKDRHEDNTDAVHAAVSAARTAPGGLMVVFRGEGVLGPFPVLELCDRLQELRVVGKRVLMVAQTLVRRAGPALVAAGNRTVSDAFRLRACQSAGLVEIQFPCARKGCCGKSRSYVG